MESNCNNQTTKQQDNQATKSQSHILLLFLTLIVISCGQKKADDSLAETGRTKRTEALLHSLDSVSRKGFLVGHQDATLYGIGWEGDSARSDIKSICGETPAVAGFEIGGLEKGEERNIYATSFDDIRRAILSQYDCGGVCQLSWRLQSIPSSDEIDRVCDFLNSLEEPYGVRVPVILRPCHENLGIDFWKNLRERIQEREVTNILFAYTFSNIQSFVSKAEENRAQHNTLIAMVDILGIEMFDKALTPDTDTLSMFQRQLSEALKTLTKLSEEYSKPAALYATGQQSLPDANWFTKILLPVLDSYRLSFVVFGRNDNKTSGHFFVPFPGHPAVSDFTAFVNSPKTLFLRDVNGLYIP